jgi:hypothetical protein
MIKLINNPAPKFFDERGNEISPEQHFFGSLRKMKIEADEAGDQAMGAMNRIASQIVGRDNGQALVLRAILRSLYGMGTANLADVCRLDWALRKDLCLIVLGLNHGRFEDIQIRRALEAAGDRDSKWFFEGIGDGPQGGTASGTGPEERST